jgi:integrase
MPRTIRDAKLDTPATRARLPVGSHYRTLVTGKLHLGYRRKSASAAGEWFVRRYVGNERYRVSTLGLADDLQAVAPGINVIDYPEAMRQALAHNTDSGDAPGAPITVRQAIEGYIAFTLTDHSERAARTLTWRVAKHILPQLGDIKVHELTTRKLIEWRDQRAAAPVLRRSKPGRQKYGMPATTEEEKRKRKVTTNRLVIILKAALNRAWKEGRVKDKSAWSRLEKFKNVNAPRSGYLSIAEAQRLINAADPNTGFRDLVQGALQTGARYGELCALKVQDFERGKLAVHRSKSGKPRHIVLTDEGIAFFTELTKGRGREEYIFRLKSGKPWTPNMQTMYMRDACKAARIEPRIVFHQLRHTWASHAVMAGMPLIVVAKNLGHANTLMVEQVYGHLAESYVDKAIRDFAPRYGAVAKSNVVSIKAN